MTTAAEETRSFVTNGLYNVFGRVYLATPENTLVPLVGDRSNPITPSADTEVTHIADPKTDEWVLRMVQVLAYTNRDMLNEQRSHQRVQQHVERLGEALLEKAVEKGWCSEYDEFADEWDLPRRFRTYEVTITIQVMAESEADAEEMVENNTQFSIEIENSPSISASEWY